MPALRLTAPTHYTHITPSRPQRLAWCFTLHACVHGRDLAALDQDCGKQSVCDLRLHAARIAGRHARYAEAVGGAAEFFHQCQRCGKTEVDDPSLHFRVTDEGDEICSACRQ